MATERTTGRFHEQNFQNNEWRAFTGGDDILVAIQWGKLPSLANGSGGFLLACENLGRMFDHSFPVCAFFFFF